MKRFLMITTLLACLAVFLPAQAQQSMDIFMQPGDERLIFVLGENTPMKINISTTADQPYWFTLYGDDGLATKLFDLAGQEIPMVRDQASNIISLTVPQPAAGEFYLELMSEKAGYWRVLYSYSEPSLPLPGEITTFSREAINPIFSEPFDNNERGWWTGDVDSTFTIVTQELQMAVGEGQVLSGFLSLPGTQSSNYYASADVRIDGAMGSANFGMAVRLIDGANFYLFQIMDGQWRFIALNESVWQPILDWQAEARLADLSGSHSIAVWVMSDTYVLVWDGEPLGHVRDTTHLGGGLGLYAEQPPNGAGTVTFSWDNVMIGNEPPGDYWAIPALPQMGVLRGELTVSASSPLGDQLVGEWFWNDTADLQSMVLRLNGDGSYVQEVAALTEGDEVTMQAGTWRIENERTLIIDLVDGTSERYTVQLDPSGAALTLPEMDNRQFVRLVSE